MLCRFFRLVNYVLPGLFLSLAVEFVQSLLESFADRPSNSMFQDAKLRQNIDG